MTARAILDPLLQAQCLKVLGHCAGPDVQSTLFLIGPDEPAFWPHFCESPEYADGVDHPLDRWSERVLTAMAGTVDGKAIFPFGGPPYHPFQTWALATGRFWASPIGFLVHDTAGLFVSFRGAILVPEALEPETGTNPCQSCPSQPCNTACPVGAFDHDYDVPSCKAHLHSDAGADCMSDGCRARRACPIGQGKRLPAQAAFHMRAFR